MKNLKRETKGITLVALVITIIILLILAGIAIANLTEDNGLFIRARQAREETIIAQEDELRRLTMLEAASNLENQTYTDKNGDSATIPAGYAVSQVEGENIINEGLVIIDKNGNEYVWIKVPKSTQVYSQTGIEITNFTSSEYEKIEKDLYQYTIKYKNNNEDETTSIFSDSYYDFESLGLTNTQYISLKQSMLKSIYENGGFWLGRYEAGSNENRSTNSDISKIKVLSQANLYPITYVTRSQANTLAQKVMENSSDFNSSLIFGIQYDLVLKFLENTGTSLNDLIDNSMKWGNYYNSTFKINRGKYAQYGYLDKWHDFNQNTNNCVNNSVKLQAKDKYNSILLTTGSSEQNKKNNIYDLAGNVWEWDFETSSVGATCYRGGGYNDSGEMSVVYRVGHEKGGNNHNIGFRVVLYQK